MMCILNRNYRFEPEQLKIIREMARNAGTKLAEAGGEKLLCRQKNIVMMQFWIWRGEPMI